MAEDYETVSIFRISLFLWLPPGNQVSHQLGNGVGIVCQYFKMLTGSLIRFRRAALIDPGVDFFYGAAESLPRLYYVADLHSGTETGVFVRTISPRCTSSAYPVSLSSPS